MNASVRPPAVAGHFYPDDPVVLRRDVARMLAAAQPQTPAGTLIGLLVPHAGYPYSGPTAAYAYSLLQGSDYATVVIISPSHRDAFPGVSAYGGDAYRTPLGLVPVDTVLRGELIGAASPLVMISQRGHGLEHAVEVQLPFLQTVLAGARILPLVMGTQDRETSFGLGRALGGILKGKPVLLVATSDLSHYHTYQEAQKLDGVALRDLEDFDSEQLMEDLETDKTEACGGGPAVALLEAARSLGADRTVILEHCNSGDVTGDRSGVVGYAAVAALRTS